jgi:hypothetical protein
MKSRSRRRRSSGYLKVEAASVRGYIFDVNSANGIFVPDITVQLDGLSEIDQNAPRSITLPAKAFFILELSSSTMA